MDPLGSHKNAHGHRRVKGFFHRPCGAAISSKFLRQYSALARSSGWGEKSLPPEPRRHRRDAVFKTRPLEDLVSPKKPPIFPLSPSLCLSLSLSQSLFSLSLSLSLCPFLVPLSSFTFIPRPSPFPPPQSWISRRDVCFFYPVSAWYWRSIWKRLIQATMWSPLPHQSRSTIRIPVKLVRFLPLFIVATLCDLPYLCGGRNMPRICLWIWQRSARETLLERWQQRL